jgi:hypothetical protein
VKRALLLLLAACGGSSAPAEPTTPAPAPAAAPSDGDGELIIEMLGQVADALGCPYSDHEAAEFCIAADGWAAGTPGELPAEKTTLVGSTVSLPEADPVDKALEQTVRFAALGIRPFQARHLLRVVAFDPAETDVPGALAAVKKAFKAKGAAEVPPTFKAVLGEISAEGYVAKQVENGWTWKSGATRAELRKVGDHWVVIEIPLGGDRGIFLSVFTEVAK